MLLWNKKFIRKTAALLLSSLLLFAAVPAVFADAADGWYFEDFSDTPTTDEGWTRSSTGGVSEAKDGMYELTRSLDASAVDATFKFNSAITTGTVVAAFTVQMNGTDTKKVLVRPRNSKNDNIATYEFRQGGGIYLRDPNQQTTKYYRVGSTSLALGEQVRIKLVFEIGESLTQSKLMTYVNGELATIGDSNSSTYYNFLSTASACDVNGLNFSITNGSNTSGTSMLIDDLHIYQVGTPAEKVAASYDSLTIDGDLSNVTDNLTLKTEDSANETTISWVSDNTDVITAEGVVTRPSDADETVNLTATIINSDGTISCTKTFPVTVTAPVASYTGTDYHFEHFDAAAPENWKLQQGSENISIIDPNTNQLIINRVDSKSYARATFTIPENLQVSSGKLAVEYNVTCDSDTDQKVLQVSARTDASGATKELFRYHIKQSDSVAIRNDKGASGTTYVDSKQYTSRGRILNVKTVLDFDATEVVDETTYKGKVTTYINGVESDITKVFYDQSDNGPVSSILFNINGDADGTGARVIIDDFKVYKVYDTPSDAQLLADSMRALQLPGDAANLGADVQLPVGNADTAITWTTSNEALVTADGKVTRPAQGESDGTVTLTATATRGLVKDKKDFVCTIPAVGTECVYLEHAPFLNQDGLIVDVPREGDTVGGYVRINNDTASPETGVILTALYNPDGVLVTCSTKAYTVAANTAGFVDCASVVVPGNGYTVKRYAFRDLTSILPILPVASTSTK